jgi:hypothetical protein
MAELTPSCTGPTCTREWSRTSLGAEVTYDPITMPDG